MMTHSTSARSSTALNPCLSELTLLLLGERLSGKSSAGNTLLGKREFNAGRTTTKSSKRTGMVARRRVTVVDTPGWHVGSSSPGSVATELRRALSLCPLEPYAILLVVPATQVFSQREWRPMEEQLRQIDVPIWHRAIVLVTRGDQVAGGAQGHVLRVGRSHQWLVERCGNRFHVLDNQAGDKETRVQVLLEMIDRMLEINRWPRDRLYTQVRERLRVRAWEKPGQDVEMSIVRDTRMWMNRQVHSVEPVGPFKRWPAELSLVLLGRRYSGKSTAGNIILGRREFDTCRRTVRCALGQRVVEGMKVTVVDSPGWSLYGLADSKQVKVEIAASPSLCPKGVVSMFLLAIPVDSFTGKDVHAMEKHLNVLGEEAWRKTVVLFTYGDELRGKPVEEHIEKNGEHLQGLLRRCGHRYHVLDNSAHGSRTQVYELLEMAERL
ncbi:hypothetical protein DPEC_G00298720 [Dallia pectoralis]|uniref:Uncharacterized protein n=1 Tax=Dallia pectoralis TaxID=75939 RepID=A0ACC2FG01_DALPE|nr:hypothetical protein DPEC_G00298720 [Dallia pectoralis]